MRPLSGTKPVVQASGEQFSIVIPTLHEQEQIGGLLIELRRLAPSAELIVADGGSRDQTTTIAKRYADVVQTEPGRALQMNAGASIAKRDVLWFLHADCRPAQESVSAITTALSDRSVVGGAFRYAFDHPHPYFRVAELCSNTKNQMFGVLYGDMGIFVRREIFFRLGGYAPIPLMEDLEFSGRLRQSGRIVLCKPVMQTSARRWMQMGITRTLLTNWGLQLAFLLGVSPRRLHNVYERYYR